MITVSGVTRRYGPTRALDGVDLEIAIGETLVVFGHNGSGKTTLLKILAGLLRPTSGDVLIDGRSPRAVRGRLGYLGHQTYLYPQLTVRENLHLYAKLYDVSVSKADDALARVNLAHKAGSRAETLSRGESQRASLARATLHNPDFLFVDEPFSGLDQASAEALPGILVREGRTLVVASHDVARGNAIADRIVTLERGAFVN